MDLLVEKKKNEVFDTIKKYKVIVEKQIGECIKVIRTDGGGEYVLEAFEAFCDHEGIVHELTPP